MYSSRGCSEIVLFLQEINHLQQWSWDCLGSFISPFQQMLIVPKDFDLVDGIYDIYIIYIYLPVPILCGFEGQFKSEYSRLMDTPGVEASTLCGATASSAPLTGQVRELGEVRVGVGGVHSCQNHLIIYQDLPNSVCPVWSSMCKTTITK